MRTWMMGRSMFGKRVTGSAWKLSRPKHHQDHEQHQRRYGMADRPGGYVHWPASLTLGAGSLPTHGVAFAQERAGLGDHEIAFGNTRLDFDLIAGRESRLDAALHDYAGLDDLNARVPFLIVEDGGLRHGDVVSAARLDRATGECAYAQVGPAAEENAHLAQARRFIDLGRNETHGAFDLACAGNLDLRFLADCDMGHASFGQLGIELDLASGDHAEQGLAVAQGAAIGDGADAHVAAADDAVGRRANLRIAATPIELAALRFNLRLLGFRGLQNPARGHDLGGCHFGRGFALIEHAFGKVFILHQRAGALERGLRFGEASLGLDDLTGRLCNCRVRARQRVLRSARSGHRAARTRARPAHRPF